MLLSQYVEEEALQARKRIPLVPLVVVDRLTLEPGESVSGSCFVTVSACMLYVSLREKEFPSSFSKADRKVRWEEIVGQAVSDSREQVRVVGLELRMLIECRRNNARKSSESDQMASTPRAAAMDMRCLPSLALSVSELVSKEAPAGGTGQSSGE